MMKLKLSIEIALQLDDRSFSYKGVEYNISTSTYKRNGKPVLAQMTVDAFEDGEWIHELSCSYHENEVLDSEQDEWLLGLI